jgi:hypothetical protein
MGSVEWTPEAELDAAALSWRDFDAKYQGIYEFDAYRWRRYRVHTAGPKRRRKGQAAEPEMILPERPAEPDAEKLWDAVIANQRAVLAEREQIVNELDVKILTDRPVGVAFFADLHIGSMGTDHAAIRRDIELAISCPHLKVYLGGDAVDNFVLAKLMHVARDDSAAAPWQQWELFRHVVSTLAKSGKLMAVGDGNHNAWTRRAAGIDGTLSALRGVPTIYTGEGGFINLTVGRQEYAVYRKHRPGLSSRYNPTHAARQALRFGRTNKHDQLPDVVVVEHQHEPSIEAGQMMGKERVFVRTGSYKVKDAHAEEFGFTGSAIGTPVVVFDPWRRRMVPFASLRTAIEYLEGE